MADVQGFGNAPPERPRKRRRRTMACTQCRSRKLRCDREYPTCSRCLNSRTPTRCTYEDGFLWQQPTTVPAASFPLDRGSASVTRGDQSSIQTADSGLGAISTRPENLVSTIAPTAGLNSSKRLHAKDRHGSRERGFLETVLGAPKATVHHEPHSNKGLLQRPKRVPEPEVPYASHEDHDDVNLRDSDDELSPSQQLDLSPRILVRGRETQTRFSGSGISANLVAQFPDIKSFAEEIRLSNPILSQVRPDLERVTRGLWKQMPLKEPFPDPTLRSLIALLPSRPVVDELIALYLAYIESMHRILHIPSFLREVDEFFSSIETPDSASAAFVVQLLLILACAWNLADASSLQNKSSVPLKCYAAVEFVLHAERWIENAQIKRPGITSLRLSILLIMAQNSHGMKRSKAWLATGTLVKQAMLAGYHRDPGRYARISVFNQEMRRRVWMTIVELDFQVAIDRGMPPSVRNSDYDTITPLNINDDAIHESTTEAPESRPLSAITDSSFQTVLARSLALRLKACSLMNSPHLSCRYEEIQRLDWELNRQLSQVPPWTTSEVHDRIIQHRVMLWKATIETKLGQSLLSIHTPFAIEARRESLFAPSARARLDAAVLILSTQRRLCETSVSLSLCMLGEWTLQAYLSVCQLLHADHHATPAPFSSSSLTHSLPGFPESLLSLVEAILIALERRFLLVIKGAKDYFFLSTIMALVKGKLWPDQAGHCKQQVVERVLSFAQALFSRHATCTHLGYAGMGSFENNQVTAFLTTPTPDLAPDLPDLGVIRPPALAGTPPGDFDPFLGVFDWEDLTGIALGS